MDMKSSTLNKLMLAAIAALLIICCLLGYKIKTRPRIATIEDAASALGIEQKRDTVVQEQKQDEVKTDTEKKQIVVTTSRVNVRDRDSEDGRVLATVEAGAEFDFVEVLGSGWTKIMYEGQEAYIISECITLRSVEAGQTEEETSTELTE